MIAACCGVSSLAVADPTAPELRARGEELAKQGRFTEAIDAFKAADKLESTATHACLIALAYTRRELWPQAEIWLATCQVRANPKDPLPDWAPAEKDQIDQRLAAANVAPVTIAVTPADANAKVTVSSFAPDEQFSPRTIHLPPGKHQIIITAPGYAEVHRDVDVVDKTAHTISVELRRPGAGGPAAPDHRARNLFVAGGAAAVTSVLTLVWWNREQAALRAANTSGDQMMWDTHSPRFDVAEGVTVGLWAVGAGLLVTSAVLKARHHEEAPAMTFAPLPGGGVVGMGWTR